MCKHFTALLNTVFGTERNDESGSGCCFICNSQHSLSLAYCSSIYGRVALSLGIPAAAEQNKMNILNALNLFLQAHSSPLIVDFIYSSAVYHMPVFH